MRVLGWFPPWMLKDGLSAIKVLLTPPYRGGYPQPLNDHGGLGMVWTKHLYLFGKLGF